MIEELNSDHLWGHNCGPQITSWWFWTTHQHVYIFKITRQREIYSVHFWGRRVSLYIIFGNRREERSNSNTIRASRTGLRFFFSEEFKRKEIFLLSRSGGFGIRSLIHFFNFWHKISKDWQVFMDIKSRIGVGGIFGSIKFSIFSHWSIRITIWYFSQKFNDLRFITAKSMLRGRISLEKR
jgi:hypothetical protein